MSVQGVYVNLFIDSSDYYFCDAWVGVDKWPWVLFAFIIIVMHMWGLDWHLWFLTWLLPTLSPCDDPYIMIYWDWMRFQLIYTIIMLIYYMILVWFEHASSFHSYMSIELVPLRNTDFLNINDTLLKCLNQGICWSGWLWDYDSI